jgi:hypothetical protein
MMILTICLVLAVAIYLAPGYTAAAAAVLAVLLYPELAALVLAAGVAAVVAVAVGVIWRELRSCRGMVLLRVSYLAH